MLAVATPIHKLQVMRIFVHMCVEMPRSVSVAGAASHLERVSPTTVGAVDVAGCCAWIIGCVYIGYGGKNTFFEA